MQQKENSKAARRPTTTVFLNTSPSKQHNFKPSFPHLFFVIHPSPDLSRVVDRDPNPHTHLSSPKDPKQIGKGGQVIKRIREVSGAGAEVRITDAGKGGDRGGVPAR